MTYRQVLSYDDLQFSLAEESGVVERFEHRRVGIFQCCVFAHESDDHFFVLTFEAAREKRPEGQRMIFVENNIDFLATVMPC